MEASWYRRYLIYSIGYDPDGSTHIDPGSDGQICVTVNERNGKYEHTLVS